MQIGCVCGRGRAVHIMAGTAFRQSGHVRHQPGLRTRHFKVVDRVQQDDLATVGQQNHLLADNVEIADAVTDIDRLDIIAAVPFAHPQQRPCPQRGDHQVAVPGRVEVVDVDQRTDAGIGHEGDQRRGVSTMDRARIYRLLGEGISAVFRAHRDIGPAVIPAILDQVELIPAFRAVFGGNDLSIGGNRKALRVAMPGRDDAAVAGLHIDAQDLAQVGIGVLGGGNRPLEDIADAVQAVIANGDDQIAGCRIIGHGAAA